MTNTKQTESSEIECVDYRGYVIVLARKGEWEVREEIRGAAYWVAQTVGECQAVIDEVNADMAE